MHGCKKINTKNGFIHTKIRNKTKTDLSRTFFFVIFCEFNKPNELVGNKQIYINTTPQYKYLYNNDTNNK